MVGGSGRHGTLHGLTVGSGHGTLGTRTLKRNGSGSSSIQDDLLVTFGLFSQLVPERSLSVDYFMLWSMFLIDKQGCARVSIIIITVPREGNMLGSTTST